MAYGIKKPRRWSWLAEAFRRARTRRALLILLLSIVFSAVLVAWWMRSLLSPPPSPGPLLEMAAAFPEEEEEAEFSVQSGYALAESLIRKAQANEYKGRMREVVEYYRQALDLLDRIGRADPSFSPGEVAEKSRLCENKLRKMK
ncbi:MAG: hypothetical protein NTV79_03115 [Candidatus Aureabacteria bacterium]|nr:hypothetical protein [Candidatus Auribacterota bacterium]